MRFMAARRSEEFRQQLPLVHRYSDRIDPHEMLWPHCDEEDDVRGFKRRDRRRACARRPIAQRDAISGLRSPRAFSAPALVSLTPSIIS